MPRPPNSRTNKKGSFERPPFLPSKFINLTIPRKKKLVKSPFTLHLDIRFGFYASGYDDGQQGNGAADQKKAQHPFPHYVKGTKNILPNNIIHIRLL
jgi:hypothetical protein